MKLKNLPKIERPREKLITRGPQNLKDEELLAILLRTGRKGKNVLELAKQILRKYSKKRFLKMNYEDLVKIKGIDSAKACTILAAQELVKRALEVGEETLPTIKSIKDVIAQTSYLRDKTREHLAALYLNARNELVFKKHIFVGTLDANIAHPREIFEHALVNHASSVILVHNHPSGDPEPSKADLEITKRIVEAGKIMGIDVLDHVIITKNKVFSFKEKKLI
ncbi:MAG: DNA repair protein RadC [Patescibacteria group bacterium]|nr:DNA repair protein RadC [Patescibacteria group bacterium]